MEIKKRLDYPLWKTPFFFIKIIIITIKLFKTGIFTLLIENQLFNSRIQLILKILNFFFTKKDKSEIGQRLLECLATLGPGYIKFGQALSTRPDLVGKDTCDFLKTLQDN